MAHHHLRPERRTLHGCFSREMDPVLSIHSGDTVSFQFLDAGWGLEQAAAPGKSRRHFQDYEPRWHGGGHALCGPVEVRGAEPGMVLEIQIGKIIPGSYGFTCAGGVGWDWYDQLGVGDGKEDALLWTIDVQSLTATAHTNRRVHIAPFLGVMGMPPVETGKHSTTPPRFCGGNIDCKELVEGSTLYLPISVPGALFSAGDGHAAQGDGEISGMAIECPIDRADLRLILRHDLNYVFPRARTAHARITFGFDDDLRKATAIAANSMLDWLMEVYSVSRKEALALASVAVDFRITQIVNANIFGVHAMLADDAIQ